MKYGTILLGIIATPLPMVLGVLVVMAVFGGQMDISLILFSTVVVSVVMWGLILISKGILHFAPWRGLRAHLTVIFLVTMIPLLLWNDVKLEPDTSFSYQLNGNSVQTFDFAIGGVIAMALVASISAMCMWIFLRFFARSRIESNPSK